MHHENGCCIRAVTWQNLHIRNVVWSSLDMNWVATLYIYTHTNITHTHTLKHMHGPSHIETMASLSEREFVTYIKIRLNDKFFFCQVRPVYSPPPSASYLTSCFHTSRSWKTWKKYTLWAPFTSHMIVYEIGRPYMTSQDVIMVQRLLDLTQMGVNVRLWINMECPHYITSWRKLSLNLFHI